MKNINSKETSEIRKCFLQMLLEGKHTLTNAEMDSLWGELEFPPTIEDIGCCVLRFVNLQTSFPIIASYQMCIQTERYLENMNFKSYTLLASNMDVLIVIHTISQVTDGVFRSLISTVEKRIGFSIQLGIGRGYNELSKIRLSMEEAYEALLEAEEENSILRIQNIQNCCMIPKAMINDSRSCIVELFRQSAIAEISERLEELAEQIRSTTVVRSDAPYPSSIRRTMIELLVEMLHIASDAGVDVDEQIGYVDPYRKIFELQGTPAIIQWVVEIAQLLSEAMQKRKRRMEQIQLEQVKTYIHQHISDMDLNLTSASQSVRMSPSYFSAFFIREAGVGFKEYVTTERIKLAQNLLKESKESINAISEQCGFLSPSYFISVFKSQTGMTPGAYRKMKN